MKQHPIWSEHERQKRSVEPDKLSSTITLCKTNLKRLQMSWEWYTSTVLPVRVMMARTLLCTVEKDFPHFLHFQKLYHCQCLLPACQSGTGCSKAIRFHFTILAARRVSMDLALNFHPKKKRVESILFHYCSVMLKGNTSAQDLDKTLTTFIQ